MSRQLKILLPIFIVLVSCALLLFWQQRQEHKPKGVAFWAFPQEQIQSFQINHFTLGLHFKKDDDKWWVKQNIPPLAQNIEIKEGKKLFTEDKTYQQANSQEISKALTYLLTLKDLKPISTSETAPSLYEINSHSLHVILFDKNHLERGRIYIGKSGPDPMTSFIKKKDSPHVYLANQDFKRLFFRKKEDWTRPLKKPKQSKVTNSDS